MGAWSVSINGNDTAQDLISEYQAAFFYFDTETALKKIENYVRSIGLNEEDEGEWCNYYYSLADFMWKKGILTDPLKIKVLEMLDSNFGLALWTESGNAVLGKRKKILAQFKQKLLSEQPPKKKIRIDFHLSPVFETGDIIAIQLKTMDKSYISDDSNFDEAFFRSCHDKWVVLRKVEDHISYTSCIVPEVKDIWPVFQLYGKIFEECPEANQLIEIPWAKCRYSNVDGGVYGCEGNLFYFKKRNYKVIANDTQKIESVKGTHDINDSFYFGINMTHYNADTIIINAIV